MSEDTKRILMLVIGSILLVAVIVLAVLAPSAERTKKAVSDSTQKETLAEDGSMQGVPVTYSMLTDMPAGYIFYEDSLVQTAAAHYTAGLTARYQEKQNHQAAEYMSLREAFSYAGVSDAVYWEIMQYNGQKIEGNDNIKRVVEKDVAYDKNKRYFMITSKEGASDLFYIGEEAKRRPDGVGAIFKEVEGNLALVYAGSFREGCKTGNGICFASYGPVMYVERIAKYSDGKENGKVYEYSTIEQENMIHMYKAIEDMIDSYKNVNQLFACIQSSFKTSDMEAIMLKWLVREPGTLYLDLPVFKCNVTFEGKMRAGKRVGRGSVYDFFGTLVYKGFVKGADKADCKEGEYPLYLKNDYLERYMSYGTATDDSYYADKGLTREEVEALWDEYASRDTSPTSISGNTTHYIDLPHIQLGEEDATPPPSYDENITVNPYINRIPYIPRDPVPTPEPEIESEPEETTDDGGTSIININE